jgi:hypothetical protein
VIYSISNALFVQQAAAGFPPALQFRGAQLLDRLDEAGIVGAQFAVGGISFVEGPAASRVTREQILPSRGFGRDGGLTHVE